VNPSPRRAPVAILAVGLLSLLAGACGGGSGGVADLELSNAAIGETSSSIAAMYLTVANRGAGDDALVGATCECAGEVTLHVTEEDGGLSKMVGTDRLELGADSTVELQPAGSHLMLERLEAPLVAGDTVTVVVAFERSPQMTLEVPVVGLASLAERVGP